MNELLKKLHNHAMQLADAKSASRLLGLCEFFLGTKYGAWQHGTTIESLDDFNYDLTALDCVTYVEVVLALLKTKPSSDFDLFTQAFLRHLRHIHYANGIPNFLNSNHFTCIDWIVNNKYILEDMTSLLPCQTQVASTQIDKLTWFKRHKINANNLQDFPEHVKERLAIQESQVPYIETAVLLQEYAKFMDLLPEYCVLNLVRPNWNLVEKIGTHLNISHMGFAIKDSMNAQIKFYHATIESMSVVVENLDQYMQRHVKSPTIGGVNILAISPGLDMPYEQRTN